MLNIWRCAVWGRLALGVAVLGLVVAQLAAQEIREIEIDRPFGKLVVGIHSPGEGALADDPMLLINLSGDRNDSLPDGRFGRIAKAFLEEGHRVASFDLPQHGERVDRHGSGIPGMAASVAAGDRPFDGFVEDGRAVIDALIERGLASSGRIMVCGVSRGGYCALRLAAADDRIGGVSALSPVTDWRLLREFAAVRDRPEVAALALTNFADLLAGRRVYVAIGNADSRVGTDACTRFILAINEAEKARALETSRVRYLMVDDSVDHSLDTRWRHEGIQFLLREPESSGSGEAQALP